jgi:hypothetical protein
MFGKLAGPEAKSVVVLGCDNNALCPGIFRYGAPLPAIEFGGIKKIFRLGPRSPFLSRKGIGTEMHKQVKLLFMPGQLYGAGFWLGKNRKRNQ